MTAAVDPRRMTGLTDWQGKPILIPEEAIMFDSPPEQPDRGTPHAQIKRATDRRSKRKVKEAATEALTHERALELLRGELNRLDDANELGDLIAGVYKNGDLGAEYGLVLTDGREVPLGTAAQILQPRKVQAAILDALHVAIKVPSLDEWRRLAALIAAAAEVREVESSDADVARGWLRSLWRSADGGRVVDPDDRTLYELLGGTGDPEDTGEPAPMLRFPDGTVSVQIDALLRRIGFQQHGKNVPSQRELQKLLGRLGFRSKRIERWHPDKPRSEDDRVRPYYWQSRPGFDLDA